MRPVLYGIPHCDSVKRAIAWLRARGVGYEFHDYKKQGAAPALVAGWAERVDWERLLNRSGTTWRKLGDPEKARAAGKDGALALMFSQPAVIRRPVLDYNRTLLVGFDADAYAQLFRRTE
jgi:Spx/MgsR family transcriptional regulator